VSWIIGVDVGGTFTDFFAYNEETGTSRFWKRPSTPSNPAEAIIEGLFELSKAHGVPLDAVTRLCHGSTVATNALIQRTGADVSMVTTKGFRDVLEIGRQTRPFVNDMQQDQPEPLVPRERRFEVKERIFSNGEVRSPVDQDDVQQVIEAIRACGTKAVAVCFLFSYLRPAHEVEVGQAIRDALPGVSVSLSSEVQPEFREFERFTTTVVNAYLQPKLEHYISTLLDNVTRVLPNALVGINQSSGGLMSLDTARSFPVRMALSGPAAGIVGAVEISKESNRPNVITIDIGGTSADVALIRDHAIELSHGRDVDGFPIRLPMIDITTVGAGGGSIAWFDIDGFFKVGPQSAGAVPGPACYKRGGTLPTVSDANLVLGRLSGALLNGSMTLDRNLAAQAIRTVAEPMGKTIEETALGILEIMTVNMVRAIRTLSVERGHDPRDFTLMPFGGAGALHARDVAVALGMKEVLVPFAPGIVCAQGLTDAPLQENYMVSSLFACSQETANTLVEKIDGLTKQASEWFERENAPIERRHIIYSADVRFRGQNFELSIEVGRCVGGAAIEIVPVNVILERFYEAHERSYGFANREAAIEIVNCRAVASASLGVPRPPQEEAHGTRIPEAPEHRDVYYEKAKPMRTPVFNRNDLHAGDVIPGPAIIDQLDATTVIYPGDIARVDAHRNILIEIGNAHE
jgi:N-methylhydantoinase A